MMNFRGMMEFQNLVDFKSWDVSEQIRVARYSLLNWYKDACRKEDVLPYILDMNQGNVCSLLLFSDAMPAIAALKKKIGNYDYAYIQQKNGFNLDKIYYLNVPGKTLLELKTTPDLLALFNSEQLPCHDRSTELHPEHLKKIEDVTQHVHYNGLPYRNFEHEPEQIAQFKTLINGLYQAEQAFVDLELLGNERRLSANYLYYGGNSPLINKTYDACQMLTDVSTKFIEYYGEELTYLQDYFFNLKDVVSTKSNELKNADAKDDTHFKSLGFFVGNLVDKMGQQEQLSSAGIVRSLTLYLPSHIESLGNRVAEIVKFFENLETTLDAKQKEALQTKIKQLSNKIEDAIRKRSLNILEIDRLYHITLRVYREMYKQIGAVSLGLNAQVRGFLAELKYDVIPNFLILAYKTEQRLLLEPGSLSTPLLSAIKPRYESIVVLAKNLIDFSDSNLPVMNLLKLEDRCFHEIGLASIKQTILTLETHLLLLNNSLTNTQAIINYFSDKNPVALTSDLINYLVNHSKELSWDWGIFLATQKKQPFGFNTESLSKVPVEKLANYLAEFKDYLTKKIKAEQFELKLNQSLVKQVEESAQDVIFPGVSLVNEFAIPNNATFYDYSRKKTAWDKASSSCDILLNKLQPPRRANKQFIDIRSFKPSYSYALLTPNTSHQPDVLYVEIKDQQVHFEVLEQVHFEKGAKIRIYLKTLNEARKAKHRNCYIFDDEKKQLSYIANDGSEREHIVLSRPGLMFANIKLYARIRQSEFIDIGFESFIPLIEKTGGSPPGIIRKGFISCAELNCSRLKFSSIKQLNPYKARLYEEGLERGFIKDDTRSELIKHYSIIQPYLLSSGIADIKAFDKEIATQLSGHFLPERSRSKPTYTNQELIDRLLILQQLFKNNQLKDLYDGSLQAFKQTSQTAGRDDAIIDNRKLIRAKIEPFKLTNPTDNTKISYPWEEFAIPRVHLPLPLERKDYLFKDKWLSKGLLELRQWIDYARTKLNTTLLDQLDAPASSSEDYCLPYPEASNEMQALRQPRPVLFFKQLYNLYAYLQAIASELEAMNQKETKAWYVKHLIKSYVDISQNIPPLIRGLTSEMSRIQQDALPSMQAFSKHFLEKTAEFQDSIRFCSIKMTEIPTNTLSLPGLANFHIAYIRVILTDKNYKETLHALYCLDIQKKTCIKLNVDEKILKRRFDGVIPCDWNQCMPLDDSHVDIISEISGHIPPKQVNRALKMPVIQQAINVVSLLPKDENAKIEQIKQRSNKLTLTMEQLFADLNSSWPTFRVTIYSFWYAALMADLYRILVDFGKKSNELVMKDLSEIPKNYCLPMMYELDKVEHHLGLRFGLLSEPFQTAWDDFYQGLITPLISDVEERISYIYPEDRAELTFLLDKRIEAATNHLERINQSLLATQPTQNSLYKITPSGAWLSWSKTATATIQEFKAILPALKSVLRGVDVRCCSLAFASADQVKNELVWDRASAKLYYFDQTSASSRIRLRDVSRFNQFLKNKIKPFNSASCAIIMPNKPSSIVEIEDYIGKLKTNGFGKIYIKVNGIDNELAYFNKSSKVLKWFKITPEAMNSINDTWYDLKKMTSSVKISNPQEGIVYLLVDSNAYFVKGMKTPTPLPEDIDLTELDKKLENSVFKRTILDIASKAGHTRNAPIPLHSERTPSRKMYLKSLEAVKNQQIEYAYVFDSTSEDKKLYYFGQLKKPSLEKSEPVDVQINDWDVFLNGIALIAQQNPNQACFDLLSADIERLIAQNGGHTAERKELDRIHDLTQFNPNKSINNYIPKIYLSYDEIKTQITANNQFVWPTEEGVFSNDIETSLIQLINDVSLDKSHQNAVSDDKIVPRINAILPKSLASCEGRIATLEQLIQSKKEQIQFLTEQKNKKIASELPAKRSIYLDYFKQTIEALCDQDSKNEGFQKTLKAAYLQCENDLFNKGDEFLYENYVEIIDSALKLKQQQLIKLMTEFKEVLDGFQRYLDNARENYRRESWVFEGEESINKKQQIIDGLYTIITDESKNWTDQRKAVVAYLNADNHLHDLQDYQHHTLFSWANLVQLMCRLFFFLYTPPAVKYTAKLFDLKTRIEENRAQMDALRNETARRGDGPLFDNLNHSFFAPAAAPPLAPAPGIEPPVENDGSEPIIPDALD